MDITNIERAYAANNESFYILDTNQFKNNYKELLESFQNIYKKSNIAYSYKTNYIPRLCSIVNSLGGFAEVVSEMEWSIAKLVGVSPDKVIFNGPCKNPKAIEELLLSGGVVNLDSYRDFLILQALINTYPHKVFKVGIRLNFDVGETTISRFGFDAKSNELNDVLSYLKCHDNICFNGVHAHFASRSLTIWRKKVSEMFSFLDSHNLKPSSIDFGGGLYGKMPVSLQQQFTDDIPTFKEYATAIAGEMEKRYKELSEDEKPLLLIEPGSALSGDVMHFVCKVDNIKEIRGKYIATVLGSIYNINPTLNKKNPPIHIIHNTTFYKEYDNIDIAGFTCIESDYMYREYKGALGIGDYIIFSNVGSYSIVLKPPFILPNFAIYEFANGGIVEIKRRETFSDIFSGYKF